MGIRQQRGFSLIELMIVLVVLAILTAIAYPSYTNQVMKSRRGDGIAALNRAAMVMESCRSDSATYVGCAFPANSEDNFYTIATIAPTTAFFYSFAATPAGVQTRDTQCTEIRLDSQGTRDYRGSAPNADTCWGQ